MTTFYTFILRTIVVVYSGLFVVALIVDEHPHWRQAVTGLAIAIAAGVILYLRKTKGITGLGEKPHSSKGQE